MGLVFSRQNANSSFSPFSSKRPLLAEGKNTVYQKHGLCHPDTQRNLVVRMPRKCPWDTFGTSQGHPGGLGRVMWKFKFNQKGLEVCYCLWGVPSRPLPGSDPGPVQVPSRVRGGTVQIRHVLCFNSVSDPSRSRGGGQPGPSWSHPAPERSLQDRAWTGRNRLLGHFRFKGQNVCGTDGTYDGTDGTCPWDRRDTRQGVCRQNSFCLLFSFLSPNGTLLI